MKINRQGQAIVLNKEQQCAVIAAMAQDREGIRNIAMLMFGLNTGCRINELRTLNIGDVVDHEGGIKKEFAIKGENAKSGKSRTVPINLQAAKFLTEYLTTRIYAKPNEPLFRATGRDRLSRSACHLIFANAFKAAGVEGASTHSMRRSFITRLHGQGVRPKVISKLAGHSSIAITCRYIDVEDHELAEAVTRL